ncbi:hypothetical protein LPJ59_001699 [Coemansia sp. RSA 2399]|nr:hypothetical protein LPJ59_001699 [Coemansia sp. RSA 2399]KAJ1905975.1 hypothetical protein LPJ81_001616 [Coemansia sp. IMI 209127]
MSGFDTRRNDRDGDALDVLGELSLEVGAGLTKQQLAVAMKLLRLGVNPSALVAITQELRKEAQYATVEHQTNGGLHPQ